MALSVESGLRRLVGVIRTLARAYLGFAAAGWAYLVVTSMRGDSSTDAMGLAGLGLLFAAPGAIALLVAYLIDGFLPKQDA